MAKRMVLWTAVLSVAMSVVVTPGASAADPTAASVAADPTAAAVVVGSTPAAGPAATPLAASNDLPATGSASLGPVPLASSALEGGGGYQALVPARVLDTRSGIGAPQARLGADSTIDVQVAGFGGVPASGAGAVVLNVTAVDPSGDSFVTVWPTGEARPYTSNLNVHAGVTAPNLVVVKLGADGKVSLYNERNSLDLVADVQGWFPAGGDYQALVPARVLDTRIGTGAAPAKVTADSSIDVTVVGVGGVPASGVGAVVLNVTAVDPTSDSYVTVWPSGESRPYASNLNVQQGVTIPNLVIAKVGADGKVSLYNERGAIDLVADVQGWLPASSGYQSMVPVRLLDTRAGTGAPAARVGTDSSIDLQVTGVGGVPSTGVAAVVLNVTAVDPSGDSFVTVWPTGDARPYTSNLNVRAGVTVPNLVIAKVGADGKVSLYNERNSLDLVADVQGWFASAPSAVASDWKIVPSSVLLNPGETRVVSLLGRRADGTTYEASPQGQVSIATTGSGVGVTYLGGNRIQLTGGSTTGYANYSATPAGAAVPAVASATVATLQPGAVALDDSVVVFPPLYAGPEDDPAALLGDLFQPGGAAGFTWAELQARTQVQTGDSALDPEDLATPVMRLPLVVQGAPPATGQIVVTGGGSSVTGRVVQPAGLPTIQRGGYSLVSVDTVPMAEVYVHLVYAFQSNDLLALGSTAGLVGIPLNVGPEQQGLARSALVQADDGGDGGDGGETPAEEPKGPCSAAPASVSLTLDPLLPSLKPTLDILADVDNAHYRFKLDMVAAIDLGFGLSFRPGGSISCTATLFGPIGEELPAPLGPLSGLLSGLVQTEIVASMSLALAAGPSAAFALRCSLSAGFTLGFEILGTNVTNLSTWIPPALDCSRSKLELAGNVSQGSIPVSLTATTGVSAKIELAGRIGGSVSRALGRLFKDPELGVEKFLNVSVGPQLVGAFETEANMLSNEAAASRIGAEVKGSASINAKGVKWMLRAFGNSKGDVSVSLWSNTSPPLDLYKAGATTAIQYTVNGGAVQTVVPGETIYVEPGDRLVVRSVLSSADGSPRVSNVQRRGWDVPLWTKTELWQTQGNPAPNTLAIARDFSVGVCQSTSDGAGGFHTEEWRIAGTSSMSIPIIGEFAAGPVWGGSFKTKCVIGKMSFDPPEVTGSLTDGPGHAVTYLKSRGASANDWTIEGPDWLEIQPKSGSWGISRDADESEAIFLNAPQTQTECRDPRTATVIARSKDEVRGTAVLTYHEPDLCYVELDPKAITSSGTVQLKSAGLVADHYTVNVSAFPSWLSIAGNQDEGDLAAGTPESFPLTFSIESREPTCTVQLPERFEVIVDTLKRGKATLIVTQPKVPRKDGCKPSTSKVKGDPHLTTFDGVYYDAQVRGEYVYARSTAAARADGVDIEVRGRNEQTIANNPPGISPTSLTAVSVRVGDHRVEVYQRDAQGHNLPQTSVLYIDGELTVVGESSPVAVGPDLSVVRTGQSYLIAVPGAQITASAYPIIMEMEMSVDPGSRFEGLLGSPDGDAANDLTAADGTTFTRDQVAPHGDPLYDFTDSWRITDPDESAFTVQYIGFDDGNVPWDSAGLQEYRVQAAALLTGLGSICDVERAADVHLLDGLAAELAIGRPLTDLARYSCSYTVRGRALSGDSAIPGMVVAATAPGLQPCTATTASDGTYQCVMNPDLVQASADPPTLPIPVAVTASFPDGGGTITSATTEFTYLALVGGSTGGAYADLTIDPSLLPNVRVSGTITDGGVPVTTPVRLAITGRNAAGVQVVSFSDVVTPSIDGTYAITRVLPYGATSADVVMLYGRFAQDYPRTTATGLQNGPNDVPLDVAYDPPRVTVSGTMVGAGGAPLGPQEVRIIGYRDTTPISNDSVTATPGTGGSYVTSPVVTLPSDATSVVAEARIGVNSADWVRSAPVTVHPGAVDVPLDVDYRPPTLVVSGEMHQDGQPITSSVYLQIQAYGPSSVLLLDTQRSVTPDANGDYTLHVDVPVSAVRARVRAIVGTVPGDYPYVDVLNLVAGDNPVTLDVGYSPPSVVVSGTMKNGAGAPLGPTVIEVIAYAGQNSLNVTYATATPAGPDGQYTIPRQILPLATTRVVARAWVGVNTSDYVSAELSTVAAGTNALTLDVAYDPPVLTVSGALVDGQGNPLPAGRYIAVTFYDGATSIGFDQQAVNPASSPVPGAYSATFTAPTHATRAVVVAYVGKWDVDKVTKEVAIQAGPNSLTLDSVYDPPVITVGGTFTGQSGPITTQTTMWFEAFDLAGASLGTQFAYVTPNESGVYSNIVLTLPDRAVNVKITAGVGASSLDWVTRTIAVTPGAQTITFDANVSVPILHVSGVLTRDGAPVTTPMTVYVRAYNAANNFLTVFTKTIVSDPNNRYSFDITAPTGTDHVQIQAVNSEFVSDVRQDNFANIHTGDNDLTFDVIDITTWITVTGTISRYSNPLTEQFQLDVHPTMPPNVYADLRQYQVTPGDDGSYALHVQVPDAATGATLTYHLPTGDDPSWTETFQAVKPDLGNGESAVVPGGNADWSYDIDYAPQRIALSGTMLVDGAGPADQVEIQVDATHADGSTSQHWVSVEPDPETGSYTATLLLASGVTEVTASASLGDESWQRYSTGPVQLTDNPMPVTFSFDHRPIRVSVHGVLRHLLTPATDARVTVDGYVGTNTLVSSTSVGVGPIDPDTGAYTAPTLLVAPTATRADVTVWFTVNGVERGFGTGLGTVVAGGNYDKLMSNDSTELHVTGCLVDDDGQPITTRPWLDVWLDSYHSDDSSAGGYQTSPRADLDGCFEQEMTIGIDVAYVMLRIDGAGYGRIDLTPDEPTWHDVGDIVYSGGPSLLLSGTVLQEIDGVPDGYAGELHISVQPYSFDPEHWDQDPPYEKIGDPIEVDVDTSDGDYATSVPLPSHADLVDIRVALGDDDPYSKGVLIEPDEAQVPVGFDIYDVPGRRLDFYIPTYVGDGSSTCSAITEGDPTPALVHFRFWSIPTDEDDPDLDADGRPLLDTIMIPDLDTGEGRVRISIPADDVKFVYHDDRSPYDGSSAPFGGAGGSGWVPDFDTYGDHGVGFNYPLNCIWG